MLHVYLFRSFLRLDGSLILWFIRLFFLDPCELMKIGCAHAGLYLALVCPYSVCFSAQGSEDATVPVAKYISGKSSHNPRIRLGKARDRLQVSAPQPRDVGIDLSRLLVTGHAIFTENPCRKPVASRRAASASQPHVSHPGTPCDSHTQSRLTLDSLRLMDGIAVDDSVDESGVRLRRYLDTLWIAKSTSANACVASPRDHGTA
ncbi:hypothetical protein EVG20_g7923 [Dentipellis fragilis]|uniref:Uncharacterized protein n=1 Tax=Dentipellis fragilis TaxID=205917 RepID=A0A4Y9YC74_9AGAM|nr:hypothetical protein EVG20_g7923 [Dentipellis fragilis]